MDILMAKVECPHCHRMTAAESGFCDECGLELATEALKPVTAAELMRSGTVNADGLTCPHCGHALRANARHCPNCGKKMTLKAAPTSTPTPNGPPSVLKAGLLVAERYGLEAVLGEGGMGRVWKAFDRHLNKYVVIKTMLTPDERLRQALQKEAEVLINIRHANIVAVIDFFTVENELCYVMEYVSGPSWADEIEEPVSRKLVLPMSAEQALTRVKALLPAFKYLHSLNPPIIYCDFKPANVKSMELPNGERIEVLLDFGTAYLYDPEVPPNPARGTPGYHAPTAAHPDWRDDYFTIGRTLAELVGMAEVHIEEYRYTLTQTDQSPWTHYDDSFRYFVEWLTAPAREDRPQTVDAILTELDGVLGYVRGQRSNGYFVRERAKPVFTGTSSLTNTRHKTKVMGITTGILGTGTTRIELPDVPVTNPASTVLISAQEAYQQHSMTRALLLANQAINNNGGAAAYVLRALIYNQIGKVNEARYDLQNAEQLSDPHVQWEMRLAEGQLLESLGKYDEAAERYRRMMAFKPGDHRGRLLLADLYRRSGNLPQAISEYRAIIQARPNVGPAYLGAAQAFLANNQLGDAIKVLEEVSSRNTSYNEVLMELVRLYNLKAMEQDGEGLEQASRAIAVLRDNGVESRQFYRLVAEYYYAAFQVAKKSGVSALVWVDGQEFKSLGQVARANEKAWREYLAHDSSANRREIIDGRIMSARTWGFM